MKKTVFLIILLAGGIFASAQEKAKQPDLQTTDSEFFDPTRKESKADDYQFEVNYRFEIGYIQNEQRSLRTNYPNMFLHGARLGAMFDFQLPLHFTLQTGALVDVAYGINNQHWRTQDAPSLQVEYIRHRVLEANLTIPVRCYYTIPLWKKLNMFFFTGPQIGVGLAQYDFLEKHLSAGAEAWVAAQGIHVAPYDRLADKELWRLNVQWTLGGGFEWDKYRLYAGYQFGLNNRVRHKVVTNQHMWEWGWFVSFSLKLR